jgi:radical SAM-linked protein
LAEAGAGIPAVDAGPAAAADAAPPTWRWRLTYRKGAEVRFISHLDVMRTLERGFRRARLPLAHTRGFNPHARLSIAAPLAVGWTASADVADVELDAPVAAAELVDRLNAALPSGLGVTGAVPVEPGAPAAMSRVRAAVYTVRARVESGGVDDVAAAVARLLAAARVPLVRETAHRGGRREVDLRPLVLECAVVGAESDPLDGGPVVVLQARLRVGSGANAKPEHLLEALAPPPVAVVAVHRDRLELEP